MKLSEAILLGDTLKTGTNAYYVHPDSCTGCAIGGALLATGLTKKEWLNAGTISTVLARWPWFQHEHFVEITYQYSQVLNGEQTLEQLVDWVRSIEPAEEVESERKDNHETQIAETVRS